MALTRAQFHAIESVQEFDDMLRGAVARALAQEDLFGYLRRDLLIAQGVTYAAGTSSRASAPDPGTPTFERVVGRPPVSLHDPFGLPMALAYLAASCPGSLPWAVPDPEEPQSELDKEEAASRLLNTQRALAEAQLKADMKKRGQAPP